MNATSHRVASNYRQQKSRDHRRGTAIVEMALVIPILLAVVLGICEFGRAMSVVQLITTATRDGCRRATLKGTTSTEVINSMTTFLDDTVHPEAGSISVIIMINGDPDNDEVAYAGPGDVVTIEARIPMSAVQYFVGDYLTDANLESSCSMLHE